MARRPRASKDEALPFEPTPVALPWVRAAEKCPLLGQRSVRRAALGNGDWQCQAVPAVQLRFGESSVCEDIDFGLPHLSSLSPLPTPVPAAEIDLMTAANAKRVEHEASVARAASEVADAARKREARTKALERMDEREAKGWALERDVARRELKAAHAAAVATRQGAEQARVASEARLAIAEALAVSLEEELTTAPSRIEKRKAQIHASREQGAAQRAGHARDAARRAEERTELFREIADLEQRSAATVSMWSKESQIQPELPKPLLDCRIRAIDMKTRLAAAAAQRRSAVKAMKQEQKAHQLVMEESTLTIGDQTRMEASVSRLEASLETTRCRLSVQMDELRSLWSNSPMSLPQSPTPSTPRAGSHNSHNFQSPTPYESLRSPTPCAGAALPPLPEGGKPKDHMTDGGKIDSASAAQPSGGVIQSMAEMLSAFSDSRDTARCLSPMRVAGEAAAASKDAMAAKDGRASRGMSDSARMASPWSAGTTVFRSPDPWMADIDGTSRQTSGAPTPSMPTPMPTSADLHMPQADVTPDVFQDSLSNLPPENVPEVADGSVQLSSESACRWAAAAIGDPMQEPLRRRWVTTPENSQDANQTPSSTLYCDPSLIAPAPQNAWAGFDAASLRSEAASPSEEIGEWADLALNVVREFLSTRTPSVPSRTYTRTTSSEFGTPASGAESVDSEVQSRPWVISPELGRDSDDSSNFKAFAHEILRAVASPPASTVAVERTSRSEETANGVATSDALGTEQCVAAPSSEQMSATRRTAPTEACSDDETTTLTAFARLAGEVVNGPARFHAPTEAFSDDAESKASLTTLARIAGEVVNDMQFAQASGEPSGSVIDITSGELVGFQPEEEPRITASELAARSLGDSKSEVDIGNGTTESEGNVMSHFTRDILNDVVELATPSNVSFENAHGSSVACQRSASASASGEIGRCVAAAGSNEDDRGVGKGIAFAPRVAGGDDDFLRAASIDGTQVSDIQTATHFTQDILSCVAPLERSSSASNASSVAATTGVAEGQGARRNDAASQDFSALDAHIASVASLVANFAEGFFSGTIRSASLSGVSFETSQGAASAGRAFVDQGLAPESLLGEEGQRTSGDDIFFTEAEEASGLRSEIPQTSAQQAPKVEAETCERLAPRPDSMASLAAGTSVGGSSFDICEVCKGIIPMPGDVAFIEQSTHNLPSAGATVGGSGLGSSIQAPQSPPAVVSDAIADAPIGSQEARSGPAMLAGTPSPDDPAPLAGAPPPRSQTRTPASAAPSTLTPTPKRWCCCC